MAQDFISAPPTRGTVDELGPNGTPVRVTRTWSAWFDRVFAICFAVGQSGKTTARPTVGLWVGRPYFDTDLGHEIWWDGEDWVDADGSAV